jgi:hypothetical protein
MPTEEWGFKFLAQLKTLFHLMLYNYYVKRKATKFRNVEVESKKMVAVYLMQTYYSNICAKTAKLLAKMAGFQEPDYEKSFMNTTL